MNELVLLIASAAFLGFIHTLLGPDHYLPFIVLGKARNWSQSKTIWITLISGIGHVGGSVIIGMVGIALGVGLNQLEAIESQRGSIVGWMILFFGLGYLIYGIARYLKNGGHYHLPSFLVPKKIREMQHLAHHDLNDEKNDTSKLTPWILFLIFVFGPCEVLIPLLMFPAAKFSVFGIVAVSLVFGLATILTMLSAVLIGIKGIAFFKPKNGDRYFHILAGLVILISGIGMQFLGW